MKNEFYRVVKLVRETDEGYYQRDQITSPQKLGEFIQSQVGDLTNECTGIVLLDTKNRPAGWSIITSGGISSCEVKMRDFFTPALLAGASSIIVFHNHPSGDTKPSSTDIALTAEIKKAGRLLGVGVLDHVIVSDVSFYSFVAGKIF